MYFRNHDMIALKGLLVLGIIHASYALIEDLCDTLPDKTPFRHPHSCSKYYTCKDKKPVEGTCLDGLYFDKEIGKCNDKMKVNCNVDLNKQCTSNSLYLADPESCDHYYICINKMAKRISCPSGSHFNPESSSCSQIDDYKCTLSTDINICEIVPKQTLFKHGDDCRKYKTCNEDNIVERSCPGSLWFNSLNGKCDIEENVKCGPEPIVRPVLPENRDMCGTPSRPYVGRVHDGLTCRGFYECAIKRDVNGNQILNENPAYQQCSKHEIFNEKSLLCVPRLENKCRFDRCDGWANEYVNIEGDGCRGYAMCERNREILRMTCPEKHYFDELTQDCVTSPIKYPSCQKASMG
ncbi:hypothetical protein ACFFRR_010367 [Megaselia abdita]